MRHIYRYFTAANFYSRHDLSILRRSRTLFTFLNVEVSVSNKDYLSLENVCVSLMSYSSDEKYFIEFKLTEMPCQNEFT